MNPLSRLRQEMKAHKGKTVCFVGAQDQLLIELALEKYEVVPLPRGAPVPAAPAGAFLNFDGVWLILDPTLRQGEFRFEEGP